MFSNISGRCILDFDNCTLFLNYNVKGINKKCLCKNVYIVIGFIFKKIVLVYKVIHYLTKFNERYLESVGRFNYVFLLYRYTVIYTILDL